MNTIYRDCIQSTLSFFNDVTTLKESAVLDTTWVSKARHQALHDFGSKHHYLGGEKQPGANPTLIDGVPLH